MTGYGGFRGFVREWWWLCVCALVAGAALGLIAGPHPVAPVREWECYHLGVRNYSPTEVACYRVTPAPVLEAHDATSED